MSTINMSKQIYQFLASAIDAKSKHSHLHYVLCTDNHQLITTDGYRMHIYPTSGDNNEPGYYACGDSKNKYVTTLYKVDDKEVGKEGFYRIESLLYPRIMSTAQEEKPLLIYGTRRDELSPIRVEDYPKVNKTGSDMAFRKGIVDSEERCVCLGINALSLVWSDIDSLVYTRESDLSKTIILDAKYVLDALNSSIVRPCMRFAKNDKPAIIGDIDSAHAVIMPLGKRR